MADVKIERGTKLIRLLADQNMNKSIDTDQVEKANRLIATLLEDLNPQTAHQIGQIVAYTVEELQQHALDFLNTIADTKNINYGEKAAFRVRTDGIHAYVQAKGGTAARSYITDRQLLVGTKEIAARPAINIVDLKANRYNIADLIREANTEISKKKLEMVETVLHSSIQTFGKPYFDKSVGGLNPALLDAQVMHFRRLGPVTILADIATAAQLTESAGLQVNTNPTMSYSGSMLDQHNQLGYLTKWHGSDLVALTNAYKADGVTPVLDPNWIYILPSGQSAEMRNLKMVNEGGVNSMASQNIDDRVLKFSSTPVQKCTVKNSLNCWKLLKSVCYNVMRKRKRECLKNNRMQQWTISSQASA